MMRLASYNIQYGKGKDDRFDLDRIVTELGEADLIALQEVEAHAMRSGNVHQAKEISARLPGMYWVYGPGIDLDASTFEVPGRRRQFGNMVLSRWPILSSINHTLPKIALHGIFHLQRTLLECVIDVPGVALRFCSVHLDHVSMDTRMPQVDYMKNVLLRGHERGASAGGALNDPSWFDKSLPPQPMSAIVMGDMNFTPGGPEYTALLGDMSDLHGRTLRAHGLADAWRLAGHEEGAGNTIPREGRPPRRIDHCFVTTDLADRVVGMTIGEDAVGSDHQPIFVHLKM